MRLISALLCAMGIHRYRVGGHSLCGTDYCIFCGYRIDGHPLCDCIFCDAKRKSDNTRV